MKLFLLPLALVCALVRADVVDVAWDLPADEDGIITGYELLWGGGSRAYTESLYVPGAAANTAQFDPGEGEWYATVRSVAEQSEEPTLVSDYSNEISYLDLPAQPLALGPPPFDSDEYVLEIDWTVEIVSEFNHYRIVVCWDGVCDTSTWETTKAAIGLPAGRLLSVDVRSCNSDESVCGAVDSITFVFPSGSVQISSVSVSYPAPPLP